LIDVDMPVGGFSPGFRCTTLHPLVLMSALLPLLLLALLLAAPAAPAKAEIISPATAIVINFMCRSCSSARHRTGSKWSAVRCQDQLDATYFLSSRS